MDTVKAVIDVGTNSIKFHVARKKADGALETVLDQNDIARLGEGLRETGVIAPEALERNALSVAAFAEKARELGADPVVVGTMALRTAKNAEAFVKRVKELTGLDVRVISGEEEARLSYLAVLSGLPPAGGEIVTFDTGGGSTEFVYGRGAEMLRKFSVPLGAVRITEEFLADDPVRPGSVDAAVKEIRASLIGGGVSGSPEMIVGMGGTVTSLASIKFKMESYDPDVVQGSVLTLAELKDMAAMFASMTLEERKGVTGLQPKRADVILAGTCIVCTILELLGASSFTVSDRGLRHGLIYELFSK
ncbi:Ppx/GppA phosphatase family protein [Aminivibrio sp.]|jgi:exopolyphosphatase/guanosine-5'-triphosphate,3'-diphosphate pyrophosphatase|uniref:Ppx/GppA phosphatase family protein n=1 Tax=Aminivibrio sp. TaxID=1872489 RepID=UPI001A542BF1|nr:Ppx/GppA phosphatase family protein [Aminivibrio sp.]MBL3540195.1 Ppx/GppA family phosphatase [Aminivibrio sp.]MDK2958706.1 exopolyphosphatase / guanosine-5-triphosphate,3-diphosphate pyrophosphatase [Synergistaceae bacterium]